jgi:hypothetical protein
MNPAIRIRIFDLEPEIAADLQTALSSLPVETVTEDPQVVFCSVEPKILKRALRRFPRRAVVVVSRLPEVRAWLDALEAGAADYCAAPFESIQLNWILQNQLSARHAAAA